MKKKIGILTAVIMLLLTGVVSAASLWGTYKGNDIIRLMINGQTIKTDVPAISMNSRTMVPLNFLKQIGVTYTWDQSKKTVNFLSEIITIPDSPPAVSAPAVDPAKTARSVIAKGGDGVTLMNVDNDLTAVVYFDKKSDIDHDWLAIQNILVDLIDMNTTYCRVTYYDGDTRVGYIEAKSSDLKKYVAGQITPKQLADVTVWNGFSGSSPTPSTSSSGSSAPTNSTVVSKIDGEFDGFNQGNLYILQNGQIWKQTSYEYKYVYKYNPKVTIYKDGAYWYMVVDGVDKQVRVEQIK